MQGYLCAATAFLCVKALLAQQPGPRVAPLFRVYVNGHTGFIDKAGKIIIEPRFLHAEPFSEGLAEVRLEDLTCGYVDTAGKVVIAPRFSSARLFSGGLAAVQTVGRSVEEAGKWGYIDRTGTIAIHPEFDDAGSFFDGRAAVLIGRKWGYIDTTGKLVIAAQFDIADRFSEGLALVQSYGDARRKYRYIDTAGKTAIDVASFFVDVFRGLVGGYIEGVAPASFNGNFSEGMATAPSGKVWGFIDSKGKFAITPEFRMVRSFSEGLAAVRTTRGWGFIDKTGRIIIAPQFMEVGSFSEGLARFLSGPDGSVWGYIDKTGKVVIPAKYPYGKAIDAPEDAFEGAFLNGLADVHLRRSQNSLDAGYIDKTGHVVWPRK